MENKKIRIGMGQLLVEGGEPGRNLTRAVAMIKEAGEKGCDIVLLPESLDLGWTHPSAKTEAKPIPGPSSDILTAAARNSGIMVCAGLTELKGSRVYNAAVLIDPSGSIILQHRKINLLTVEFDFYAIGNTLATVETPFGVIGLDICADNYNDALEIGHTLARMGSQIILSPSSWTVDYHITEDTDPYGEKWFRPFYTLAHLYNLVIVSATSVGYIVGGPYEGKKSVGCSLAVGRDGIIAQGTYNEFAGELIIAEFTVPVRTEKGTEIGALLTNKGYYDNVKLPALPKMHHRH
ncbi:MAG: carbon-nitrogen hydrolase family protein [Candidatus Omnitrophica bacterium]|nr:carbon-nitrogen hydrolase family protein [Candidatus Omnitrophota bacterium]